MNRHHPPTIVTVKISVRKSASVVQIHQLMNIFLIHMIILTSARQIHIRILSVQIGCKSCIFRLLHTAFDLQGIHPCINQIRQQAQTAQILRAQQITAAALVVCLKRPGKTAWLCTSSAIAASTPDHTAHQTLSGITVAKGTMYKCLNLNACPSFHICNLRQIKFTGRYNP